VVYELRLSLEVKIDWSPFFGIGKLGGDTKDLVL
jgi:hypothetical protein